MRTILVFILTFLLVWTIGPSGYGQDFPFVHFPNRTIASAKIFAIQQNQNKETQFVTREGVFSFNGRLTNRVFRFSAEQSAGISQAMFAADNKLLVLFHGNLFAIDTKNKKAEKVIKGAGLTEKIFYYPQENKVYLLTGGAIKLLRESGETELVLEGVKNADKVWFSENEILLTDKNSLRVYGQNWKLLQRFTTGETITDSYFTNGRLLILTPKYIYSREDNGVLKKLYAVNEDGPVCILEDQTGKIWTGTKNSGLILYDGNQVKSIGLKNNFPLQQVQGMFQSRDLSLWFYGNEGLVFRPFSAPFLIFRTGKHLPGQSIQDISAAGSAGIAVLTRDSYLHQLKNETVQKSEQFSVPFTPEFSKITGGQGSVQLSKTGELFYRNSQKTFRYSLNREVVQLFSFKSHSLILCRMGEVYSFNHERMKLNRLKADFSAESPAFQNGESLVFTSTKGQLIHLDGETGKEMILADSMPEDSHIAILNKKYLLLLRKNGDLRYLADGILRNTEFSLKAGEEVTGFLLSASGVWISTEKHLYQAGLNIEADGSLSLQEKGFFDAEDYGLELPLLKCIENEEGSYWLASKNNLYLYNSMALAPDVSPPGFILDRVLLQRKDSLTRLDPLRKDSLKVKLRGDEHLIIQAFAVKYDQNTKASVKYRFPLTGQGWKEPLQEGLVLISDLKPGNHVVELLSENGQGVTSSERAVFLIEVSKTPWNKWFLAAGVSFGILLAGFTAFVSLRPGRDSKSREAGEKYERELQKLRKRSHEQMIKADGLKQVNELISAQKVELEEKNKQIIAQKYELSLTNNQIKQQKNLIEKTSEKLQSSINYAKKIQTALMGDEILIKEDLPESFVFFKPRDQVSGDFFWFEKAINEQGEELFFIAAVDCTGHGVPGAIVSVVGIQLLNAIVNAKKIYDPGQILTQLNTDLLESLKYEQTKVNDGMDMSLCTINLSQKKLLFAGAKNPVYYFEEGELHIVKGDKMPIGGQKLKEETPFQTHEIHLRGDGSQMFYLFSDGYQDQFGGPDQFKFLVKNFKELLTDMSSKSMMEQKYMLGKTINEWQGNEEQTDDILVLGFRI